MASVQGSSCSQYCIKASTQLCFPLAGHPFFPGLEWEKAILLHSEHWKTLLENGPRFRDFMNSINSSITHDFNLSNAISYLWSIFVLTVRYHQMDFNMTGLSSGSVLYGNSICLLLRLWIRHASQADWYPESSRNLSAFRRMLLPSGIVAISESYIWWYFTSSMMISPDDVVIAISG